MKLYGVTGMKSYFFNVSYQNNLNQNEMNELLYYDEFRLRNLGCVRFMILIAAKYKLFAFFRKVI